MATVLVLAPHAMDEVLGAGGVMALHADAGHRVETLVLFGDGSGLDAGRRIAAPAAAAILGAASPRFAGFPENRGDTVPLIDVVGAVEKALSDIAPQILLVPHGGNLNIDHHITFRAALTAARPLPGHPVRAIYAYEVASSTEWSSPALGPTFLPNRFVDVGAAEARKLEALDCYCAEMRSAPHPRSVEGIGAQLRHRGSGVGCVAAEAFVVVREVVDRLAPV